MAEEEARPGPEPEPPPKPAGQPAAVKLPAGYGGGVSAVDRNVRVHGEFSPMLGGGPLYVRNQVGFSFITTNPRDTMFFAKSHPKAGFDRYRWEGRGDGVMLGYLVEDEGAKAQ